MNSGSGSAPGFPRELSVERKIQDALHALQSDSIAVIDDWLTPDEARAIRTETLDAFDRGELAEARIGRGGSTQRTTEIRGDLTRWWNPADPTPAQRPLRERLEKLRTELNRAFYLGLRDWEGHSAVYEPGTFYKKHLDRFRDDDRRTVSVVVYFNPEWKPGDGGELRAWLGTGSDAPQLDIEPLAGRAVIFLSDRIPHEVLPAHTRRISFAGWLRRA